MQALATGGAPAASEVRLRGVGGVLYGRVLTLAVGLCASAPVIAAAVRALNEGWQPVADRGIIATRAFDVLSSHMPLVGQYSFASKVTGELTYSLGPMLYWVLAPAAHAGAPGSFVITMAVLNVACVLLAVALARRRGGVWLMVAAAVGIGLASRSLAANNFYDIWNPSAGLFPLLALIFVGWSLACGEYRLAPATVLLGSFLLQCEAGFVPPTLAALGVGVGGLAVWWVRVSRAGSRPRTWPWMLAALVILVACWTPALIDQVDRSGNVSRVVRAAKDRKSPYGSKVGARAVVRTVGVRPWWLIRPANPFERKFDLRRSAGTLADLSTALILGWLLLAAALALRRRRADITAGALLALLLCAAVFSIASATPSTPRFLSETLGFTMWSATTVGLFAWLIAAWAAVVLSGAGALAVRAASSVGGRRRPRASARAPAALALAAAVALALAGLAGGTGAAAGEGDEHAFEFAGLKEINDRLGAVPSGHAVFLNAKLDGLITPLRPELTYALRSRGVRPLGTGAYIRTGHWYERAEHPYDYVVWVYDQKRPPVRDARVIASGRILSHGRIHTVSVALSRAPRAASRPRGAERRQRRGVPAAAAGANGWSAPASLPGCATAAPRVAFPSEGPFDSTGPGALVWATGPCRAGGADGTMLALASLSGDGRARAPTLQRVAFTAAPALSAVGASFGRVAMAAGARAGGADGGILVQARPGERLARPVLRAVAGQPLDLARAYLGDVAVATVVRGPAIAVRVQRYFQRRFGPPRLIPIRAGRLGALAATLDYRSDVLVAWQQGGSVYAHMLRASGRPEATQRVGEATAQLQLQALVSDNDHGMLAWSSTSSEDVPLTSVYFERSGRGVRFGEPRRLALFADPARAGSTPGSLALVRLSNENVMLAWTQVRSGHYVVQAAPAVYAGRRPAVVLSDPGSDSLLADVATGPEREAIAAWRSTPGGTGFDPSRSELWTARTFTRRGDRPAAAPAVMVAPAGPLRGAGAGVDPASDRPVVAWLAGGSRPHVEYVAGPADPSYRPRGAPGAARGASHWLRIVLAALAGVVLLAALGWALLRRRARGSTGRAGRF